MAKLPGQMISEVANIPLKGLQGIGKSLLGGLQGHGDGAVNDDGSPAGASSDSRNPQDSRKISPALNNLGKQLFKRPATAED